MATKGRANKADHAVPARGGMLGKVSLTSGNDCHLKRLHFSNHFARHPSQFSSQFCNPTFYPNNMESLGDEIWDIIIAGTSITQSLLAL